MREFSTADLRALAAFRVAFCAYLLARFVLQGAVPAEMGLRLAASGAAAPALMLALSVVQYLLLVLIVLGYRTRWSAGLLLLVFGALNFSLFKAETVLLLLVVVLPVARYVSLDDAMDRGAQDDGALLSAQESLTSVAVAAVRILAVLHLMMLALYSTVLPAQTVAWMSASALLILVATLLPRSLSGVRFSLTLAGAVSLLLAGLAQQLSEGSALAPWLGAALALTLLPASGFEILSNHRWFAKRHALRIYYDRPCGFCRKICFIFTSFMLLGRCQIAAAQTHEKAHELLRQNDSWVVFDGPEAEAPHCDAQPGHELCWAAVLLLMRRSPLWMPLGWLLTVVGMGVWGKPLYRLIGASRGVLSALTARLLPYVPYRTSMPGFLVVIASLFSAIVAFHLCINISHYVTGPLGAWLGR